MKSRDALYKIAFDKKYLTEVQYAGMGNYKNRKSDALLQWYADQYNGSYDLSRYDDILELGCGDGTFWKYVADGREFTPHVVITDLAEKMLDDCKANLTDVALNAGYQVADMDVLPFGPGSFNAVVAHKVIYHSEDPAKAIAGIVKVLKPDGLFGLSVLNSGVYKSVWTLANSIEERIPDASLSSRFSDVEADAVLPGYFPAVETRTYVGCKTFANSDAVVELVKTNPIVQPLKLSNNFFSLFKEKVDEEIEKHGTFDTEYNSNLYLCRK